MVGISLKRVFLYKFELAKMVPKGVNTHLNTHCTDVAQYLRHRIITKVGDGNEQTAFSLESVLRIPFYLSDVISNASF